MEKIDRLEKLFASWAEWRHGPLASASPGALELLFQLLWRMDDGDGKGGRRGVLLWDDVLGGSTPLTIAETPTFAGAGQTFGDWEELSINTSRS